jgi:site-specific DNA-methyltransferase (adenine-specific)
VLFRSPTGEQSQAQIEAFEDTWHWNATAEQAFDEVMVSGNTRAAEMLRALRSFLGENDMSAYIAMMSVRMLELRRVLRPDGSLALHCDTTASHYLRIVLDSVFGPKAFANEIIWKRTTSHNDAKNQFPDVSDHILFYAMGDKRTFNRQYVAYGEDYLASKYRHKDAAGRVYRLSDLRSPSPRPNLTYDYKGHKPHPNGWAVSQTLMAELDAKGLLEFPRKEGGRIQMRDTWMSGKACRSPACGMTYRR